MNFNSEYNNALVQLDQAKRREDDEAEAHWRAELLRIYDLICEKHDNKEF